ncbi:hypothetical protein PZ938_19195 [Luteipulveratus sp. YIM 133132]|uniref:hypothetical protein n=1 Tax=Luteipulveratus flavus TaxID=3031728 RepID=UPI0023B1825A|nr:hypothetical protein [Luteipulveratus sp. YIM 133132]MDE9367749.1 hypothetical protein [Luteipulveratus sp. YIM 133132]
MSVRRTTATLGAVLLATSLAISGCSKDSGDGGSQQKAVPSTWSAAEATNTSDKPADPQQSNRKALPTTTSWNLKLAKDSAMVDYADWPDVQELYTREQLLALFPDAKGMQNGYGSFGQYGNGQLTPKNTTASYTFKATTEKGSDDGDSPLRVKLRGIGADSEVTKSWDATREQFRAAKQDGDVFYQDGAFGARRALFRPGQGLGSFVISDGQIAAWVDLQFQGFAFVSPQNTSQTADILRTQVFPLAIEDVAGKLPRKYA